MVRRNNNGPGPTENLLDMAANMAPVAASLVPGKLGYAVGAGVQYVSSSTNIRREEEALAESLGVPDLDSIAGRSRQLRAYIAELEATPIKDLGRFGIDTAAGVIGGTTTCAAATFLFGASIFTGPVGWVAGGAAALAGGIGGTIMVGGVCDALCGGQDPLKMVVARTAAIRSQWQQGAKIDKNDLFLVLASRLPEAQRKLINEDIAAMREGDKNALTKVRRRHERLVSYQVKALLGEHYHPELPAMGQLAKWMNTPNEETGKRLDPAVLLLDHLPPAREHAQGVEVTHPVSAQRLPRSGRASDISHNNAV